MKTHNKHEPLRDILIKYDCPEYGDVIVDEICRLFGYAATTDCIYDHDHSDGKCLILED